MFSTWELGQESGQLISVRITRSELREDILKSTSYEQPFRSGDRKRSQSHTTRIVSTKGKKIGKSRIDSNSVPANCSFEVEDCEDEWTYSQKFDLIHGRLTEI